ncbi:hypothetical protein SU69_06960 [Thermosipho melanesiensis]|uniref:Probable cell division protein WhiA n=2 Tax=Thermosipho melanesiensis TaxID=46541 RepID=A6LMS1_THEM4|nr:DNA-binding protein WhiA [Thermosipho melanesiensis]ABR31222.1 protein of unknown function DUF199 [Thermosipho melanesiensis BI429]APT74306.1 hypothetical protein BW47_07285 [Thermosipho melanesiensis]OOC36247.1 hypothetical protein SU68_07030 [Thermosipho melanesiensis]OOC37065.1 hypothetical protein SU69_06960 [Thermosipho melanesiensis]OOC37817.1 hypothetical protein SU70_06970 [Thermosipho melanesiensis]
MLYTFSEDVKGELCHIKVTEIEAKSELSGFLKSKGILIKTYRGLHVKLEIGFIPAARRVMNLMGIVEVNKEKLTLIKNKLKKKRVQIFIPFSILEKLEVSILRVPSYVFEDWNCFAAFLRGVFVSSGSITDPAKNYHFEIISHNEEFLNTIKNYLSENLGINGKVARFNNNFRFYVKRARDIIELLNFLGAQRNANKMERMVSTREVKGDLNRTINFIEANAKRVADSNAKQINLISSLIDKYGMDVLPEELKQLAILRLENEDLSLSDLGKKFTPPLSKSMVYNRIRKIFKIYEDLEGKRLE